MAITSSGLHPLDYILGTDAAELARGEITEEELADTDAVQLLDLGSDGFEHAADLAVHAFLDFDFEPGGAAGEAKHAGGCGVLAAADREAAAEEIQGGVGERGIGEDVVELGDFVFGVGDAFGEDAVVGEQEQSAGVEIEAADGEIPSGELADDVVDGRATAGVA